MIKKFTIAIFTMLVALTACRSDDDGEELLPIEEQNALDDLAIEAYLEDHYFNPERGYVVKFDDIEDNEDDEYPSLRASAVRESSGIWYVKRDIVPQEGRTVVNNENDSILIAYNLSYFVATKDYETSTAGLRPYNYTTMYSSTINGSGLPIWDPSFYFINLTATQITQGYKREYFEIEGIVEGLKHFNSTERDPTDIYDFQGLIIVPSRLAFARDWAYTAGTISTTQFRDCSFILNFELLKVIDRIP